MTKLRRMDILLSNPRVVYFPGQVIQGQLLIELSADMKMRGVRIKCRGRGLVGWSEGTGDNKQNFSAIEDYVQVVLVLYGNGPQSGDNVVLREGSHSFPFQFILPQGLPGSFEGRCNCYVRYWLKGTIDKPWKFDPEVKSIFTIGSVLDLNTVQGALTSVTDTDSKTVCCCCCESDPIKATLRLDKSGYVPGEAIICDAEIFEGTGRGTHSAKMKLMQLITYIADGGGKACEKNECARLQHGPIQPGGNDVFSGERLVIPPLPPSYLPGCNIINIDYMVKLEIDVVDTPYDLDVTVAVIIGTIPLQSVVQQYRPQTGFGTDSGAFTNQPVPMGAPVNFDLPPPSYQECVFGKVNTTDDDDKHATGNMNYAPSYTYYDWMNPVPAPSAPPPT